MREDQGCINHRDTTFLLDKLLFFDQVPPDPIQRTAGYDMDKQSNPHGKSAVAKRMAELGIRAAIWDARVTAAYLGISRSCLYNYVRDGRIGRPIRLGPNRTGFRREDIEKWVANRQAA